MNRVAENLQKTLNKVRFAAERAGRNAEEIKLVAVSKTVDVEQIKGGIKAGIQALGENRVQDFLPKYEAVGGEVEWHFIGHLQSNKVRNIIDKVTLIHSLDRWSLAEEINKRAGSTAVLPCVLVQVNISGEDSKFGMPPEEVLPFLRRASKLNNLKVCGLMTMAPFAGNPEEVRPVFRELKQLFDTISQEAIDGVHMDYLSMGMTNDFEVAIEEGANIVRIGRAIFS